MNTNRGQTVWRLSKYQKSGDSDHGHPVNCDNGNWRSLDFFKILT